MNILWITNNVLPDLACALNMQTSASGSWLVDWSLQLSKNENVNLAIATVSGDEFKKTELNNITYYLLPGTGKNMLFYTKKYEKLWQEINKDFKPDIVHLHGTEYSHGLSFLRANPNVKAVVSVQGIISKIKDRYFDGLPKFFAFKYTTIKEIIKLNGIWFMKMLYGKNSRYEKEIFARAKYANCVNTWDTSVTKEFNSNIKIYKLEYNLREEFYSSGKWDINAMNRHQIFTNPGGDSIKGLHILLKAMYYVKKEYPDVCLVVPGMGDGTGKIAIRNGYSKYIKKLVKELGLVENIKFCTRLSGDEMRENMINSNVCVVPSAIEGTSLVLRESMFLGVPTISSFRGGMADFIKDGETGFVYDFEEYSYLAERIIEIFADDDLANNISKKAIKHAESAHDRKNNIENMVKMYNDIYDL